MNRVRIRYALGLAVAALLLAACSRHDTRPEKADAVAPPTGNAQRLELTGTPIEFREMVLLRSAKPEVAKKSCTKRTPFELDCAAGDLFTGVEPTHHPIDDLCPTGGTGRNDALKVEYATKNNLCVVNEPITVTLSDFLTLQADLDRCPDVHYGSATSPPNPRTCLQNLNHGAKHLGEGMPVRLVAYVKDSHLNKGEGVNCGCTDAEANDYHITLVANKGDLVCSGIVVEMIPHFRPVEWDNDAIETLVEAGNPVRVEGPLFADTSHQPKPCGSTSKRSDPKRSSVWEIHPVKRFQVCSFKTRAKCKADDDTVWNELPEPQEEE